MLRMFERVNPAAFSPQSSCPRPKDQQVGTPGYDCQKESIVGMASNLVAMASTLVVVMASNLEAEGNYKLDIINTSVLSKQ